jgi:hypothetical protein
MRQKCCSQMCNAHKEVMRWKVSCNLVQYSVAMHLIKCWSQVLHNSHHDRLCKPLCCSRFFRKKLWKNSSALRLLDANVALWEVEWKQKKEWEWKKEREEGVESKLLRCGNDCSSLSTIKLWGQFWTTY